jgi:hypothetical protein
MIGLFANILYHKWHNFTKKRNFTLIYLNNNKL